MFYIMAHVVQHGLWFITMAGPMRGSTLASSAAARHAHAHAHAHAHTRTHAPGQEDGVGVVEFSNSDKYSGEYRSKAQKQTAYPIIPSR